MESEIAPQGGDKTFGQIAAANLRQLGWTLKCDYGTRINDGQCVVDARKGDLLIVVEAPDLDIALLEVEKEARLLGK